MFKKHPLASAINSAAVAGALAASGMAIPTVALGSEAMLEEVVVTGSRIRRTDLEAVSPVSVVNSEEFTISGIMNIEQKIAELPQTLPSFGPSSNNPGDGTARVDLRGLGTSRTLVLVNGRRWVPATQSGVVDLNTIPPALIESVDVVTGGASAVYGSDAIAGVVNFKLRDDFEGVEISGLYDVTSENDAEKANIELTIGGNFADGRGNAVLYGMYSDRESLFQGERSFTNVALTESDSDGDGIDDILVPGGSSGIPGTRLFGGPALSDPDGLPGTGDETFLGRFQPDGSGAPFTGADRFNYAPDNYLQLPQKRWLIHAMVHYDITDSARLYAEYTTVNNEVPQELAPTPAFVSTLEVNPNSVFFAPDVQAVIGNPATLVTEADFNAVDANGDSTFVAPSESYFVDFSGDGVCQPGEVFQAGVCDTNGNGAIDPLDNAILPTIGRRMVENGPRQANNDRDAMRFMVGLTGDINEDWSYDVYASRSELDEMNTLNNDVAETRFRQAVLVTDDGTACANPANGCAPMNIFGEGNISADAVGFVNVGAANITEIVQTVVNGTVTGSLGNLIDQNQPVGVAFGMEYREDRSSFRPDEFLSAGDVLGFNAGEATKGSYDATEFFAEVDMPILSGRSGVEYLGVWGAYRYSDYSNIGDIDSWATTLTYAPVSGLSFRAGYQSAVRAPNVAELFGGQANGFPGATDPCSNDGTNLTDAATVDTCVASGLSAAQVGVFTQANTQIEGLFGGNPNLKEESADTMTFGVVFQAGEFESMPEALSGLDVTVDYYSIEVDDAISILGGSVNNVLDICFNQVQDINSQFCQAVSRRPDGNVDVVEVLNANIAKIETEGVDVNANYVLPLNFGLFGNDGSQLAVTYRTTFLTKFEETPTIGLPTVFSCEGNFGNTCGDPRPEYQHMTRATWTTGPLTLSMLWRFIGESDDDRIDNAGAARNTILVNQLDSINYFDLSGSWEFGGTLQGLRINAGVRNLFDEEPQAVGDVQEQANTFPETYDAIGRRFFVSATYRM